MARVVGIDVARGALMAYIICVIHGVFWFHLVPEAAASILLFEMPPIFIIAGAALCLSEREKHSLGAGLYIYFKFLLRRGTRILLPYWAYALVCALITLTYGGRIDVVETIAAWLNPLHGGAGHSILMLNWHLWFVSPFLAVTALLPLLAHFKVRANIPLWAWAAGATTFVHVVGILDTPTTYWVQMVVFYMLWALFGYALIASSSRFGATDYATVLILSLVALAVLFVFSPADVSFNMQTNKFPPNAIFFLFSCAWVSLLLLIVRALNARFVVTLADIFLLKPFIDAGYSIYLWQGLGYSLAVVLGRTFGLKVVTILPIAIAITIVLGLLAAPLERLRFKATPTK